LAQKSHDAQNSVPPLSNAVTSQVFFYCRTGWFL